MEFIGVKRLSSPRRVLGVRRASVVLVGSHRFEFKGAPLVLIGQHGRLALSTVLSYIFIRPLALPSVFRFRQPFS